MRKRLLAVLALAVLVPTVLVTSCATDAEVRAAPSGPALPAGGVEAARAAAGEIGGDQQVGGTLRIMGLLSGEQLSTYLSTLAPLEEATGIRIEYESAGDLQAVLQTRIEGGNPPDVVSNPSAGQVRELAGAGELVPVESWLDMAAVRGAYPASLQELATVDGRLYGVFVNTAVQGLVWYAPASYDGPRPPADWAALGAWTAQHAQRGATPWCLGVESGPSSGWPGAVWIEQFVLQQGAELYDDWWQGRLPWTSSEVRAAFESFGRVATDAGQVSGGATAVLTSNFAESPKGMFAAPPACSLHLQGDWLGNAMAQAFPDVRPVEDVDFFPFPPAAAGRPQPLEITGEMLAAFRDTPQVRALMQYVTTPEYSALVAATGSWLGANRQTPPDAYTSELSRRVAQLYAGAEEVRFGAKDAMPTPMSHAFLQSVVAYLDDPGSLDAVLADLERVRAEAY